MKMDANRRYVLCEFLNEDTVDADGANRPVREGHAEWILSDPNSPTSASTLIDEKIQVTMKWPTSHDVMPVEAMRKLGHVDWRKNVVAIILAQSDDWTAITDARRNFIKFGIPFPTREQRKEIAKCMVDSNNNKAKPIPGGQESRKRKIIPDNHQSVRMKVNKQVDELYDSDSSSDLPLKKLTKKTVSNPPKKLSSNSQKHNKKFTKIKTIISDSEDSVTSNIQPLEKDEMLQEDNVALKSRILVLEEEVATLKRELTLYQCMRCIVQDFPKLSSEVRALTTAVRAVVLLLSGSKSEQIPARRPVPTHTPKVNIKTKQSEMDLSLMDTEDQDNRVRTDGHVSLLSITDDEEYIKFGSKRIPRSAVNMLPHQKESIIAAELTSVVFTPYEMALSSMKGRANNKAKNVFVEKPLDEERVIAIIDYICKKKNLDRKSIEPFLRTAIANKLNNFSKSEEGKRIIAEHISAQPDAPCCGCK